MRTAFRTPIVLSNITITSRRYWIHFNFSISSNQRRKILVGIALPYCFNQLHECDEQSDGLEDRLDELHQILDDADEPPEYVDSCSTNSVIEHEIIEDNNYSPETIVCDNAEPPENDRKRKVIRVLNGSELPKKLIKVDLNQCKLSNGQELTNLPHRKGNWVATYIPQFT